MCISALLHSCISTPTLYHMVRIALTNQKGGVGKTTTTLNLGYGLALSGKRVLLVDLDPQANLTSSMDLDPNTVDLSLYDVISGVARPSDVIRSRPVEGGAPIDILPSTLELTATDMELAGKIGRETRLRSALETISGYDFILLDCPPNLGLMTINALAAADEVLVVSNVEPYALNGMANLTNAIDEVRTYYKPNLRYAGAVATRFDGRKNVSHEVLASMQSYWEDLMFETVIRDNVRLVESPSHKQSIFEYDPKCHGAEDYHALTNEFLQRHEQVEVGQ